MLNIRKITFLLTLLSTSYKIVGATTHDHDLYFLDDDLACSATKVIAKTIMNNYKENKAGEIFQRMKADKYTTPESRYAVAEWVVRTVCNKERGLFDGYEVQGEVGERKYVDMTYKLSLDEKIKKLNEEKEAKEQTLKEEDESEEGKATDDGEIEEVTQDNDVQLEDYEKVQLQREEEQSAEQKEPKELSEVAQQLYKACDILLQFHGNLLPNFLYKNKKITTELTYKSGTCYKAPKYDL